MTCADKSLPAVRAEMEEDESEDARNLPDTTTGLFSGGILYFPLERCPWW
jgi:hypothetical protein